MDKPEQLTTSETLTQLLEQLEKEAKDSTKETTASPYPLVRLSGIRRIFRAFQLSRELLVHEKVRHDLNKEMTIDEKNKIEALSIKHVDKMIDELM